MQEFEQRTINKTGLSLPEGIILVTIVGILISFGVSLL